MPTLFSPTPSGRLSRSRTLILCCLWALLLPAGSRAATVDIPPALGLAVGDRLARDIGPAYRIGADGRGANPRQGLTLDFDDQGVRIHGEQGGFRLRTLRFGRGAGESLPTVPPRREAGKVSYRRGADLEEWFLNLPQGLEQGWTVNRPPAGEGPLTLVLDTGRGADRELNGLPVWSGLVYGGLAAWDADGTRLAARLEHYGARLRIEVDDTDATYPVVIDPWVQQAKLVAADGEPADRFGTVALSGDTALVGASTADVNSNSDQGAVYVFVRSGNSWNQQAKLVAADGKAGDSFGFALDLDGDTALIGTFVAAVGGNVNQGAVYVYTRSGTTWTLQAKLIASDGAVGDFFGTAVALDGNTALIGADIADTAEASTGAAYIFERVGTVWTQKARLAASDGKSGSHFGGAVALDGTTALIGAFEFGVNGNRPGAAYVFTGSGENWTEQAKLSSDAPTDGASFGTSVALQGDTALIGADAASIPVEGAVYVFTRSGTTWVRKAKLLAGEGVTDARFGNSVALWGSTALVGAWSATVDGNPSAGAAYVFVGSGSDWRQQAKLSAGAHFGSSVALEADTALIGAPITNIGGNASQGAAYVFGAPGEVLPPIVPTPVPASAPWGIALLTLLMLGLGVGGARRR